MLKFMWYNFLSQTTVIKSTTIILGKWIKESIAYTLCSFSCFDRSYSRTSLWCWWFRTNLIRMPTYAPFLFVKSISPVWKERRETPKGHFKLTLHIAYNVTQIWCFSIRKFDILQINCIQFLLLSLNVQMTKMTKENSFLKTYLLLNKFSKSDIPR